MQYRRAHIKGGTYFLTVNLAERKRSLLVEEIDKLRNTIATVKKRHPFKLDAIVVLPDHIHALWTMPQDDCDYATRWMLIKSNFSRQFPKGEPCNASRTKKGERGIWQRRYWEHVIRDAQDYNRHVDYIHYNPVKHGYVNHASDWPYSSIHRFIAKGVLDRNWGSGIEPSDSSMFGESLR